MARSTHIGTISCLIIDLRQEATNQFATLLEERTIYYDLYMPLHRIADTPIGECFSLLIQ